MPAYEGFWNHIKNNSTASPMATTYTARDIMKALPVLERLKYKKFSDLKAMYRAGGGEAKGNHITKRDCIMFIAFGIGPTETSELDKANGTIRELELQLKAERSATAALRSERDAKEKVAEAMYRERDLAWQQRDQLIGTFRQLMQL